MYEQGPGDMLDMLLAVVRSRNPVVSSMVELNGVPRNAAQHVFPHISFNSNVLKCTVQLGQAVIRKEAIFSPFLNCSI